MASFTKEAAVALVFAVLYFALAIWMATGYATGRYKLRSRWSLLAFHITVRVASQACGVAFGILAFDNINLFLAFLILGAEGYFTLTLAAYLFLKSWHKNHLGTSFLAPTHHLSKEESSKVVRDTLLLLPIFLPWKYVRHHFLMIVHAVLIPANAIIISGGSILANVQANEYSSGQSHSKINTSRAMRTTGSVLFYCMTLAFLGSIVITVFSERKFQREGRIKRTGTHPTLFVLFTVAFFLLVRGMFGILQSAIMSLSYTSPDNYTSDGFTARFTAIENCLTVLPEFMAAFLLNMTWFTSRDERQRVGNEADSGDRLEAAPE